MLSKLENCDHSGFAAPLHDKCSMGSVDQQKLEKNEGYYILRVFLQDHWKSARLKSFWPSYFQNLGFGSNRISCNQRALDVGSFAIRPVF